MKLATYQDGSRDGQLLVVSRDLASAHYASGIATRLQQVLDDWNFLSPQLEELSQTLNHGKARHAFAFDPAQCMAPLPRAYQWATAVNVLSATESEDPTMERGASDALFGAQADAVCAGADGDIDVRIVCHAQLAAITGDMVRGTSADTALEGVRLLMLAHETSPQSPTENGSRLSRSTAFSPVAATPDEFGSAWQGGRLHLQLERLHNNKRASRCDAGAGARFSFAQLIAHLCRTRPLQAGSIVGSGAITAVGAGDAAEAPVAFGDTLRTDITVADGQSLFGAISQRVVRAA